MSEPRQVGTTPQGGHYIQSSGVSSTNPGPSIVLPAAPVLEAPDTVKLDDGAEVPVKPYTEDRSVMSFKRSEIQRMSPETYAKYKDQIIQANVLGTIEDDVSWFGKMTDQERDRMNDAMIAKDLQYRSLYAIKQAKQAEDETYKVLQGAKQQLEHAENYGSEADVIAAKAVVEYERGLFNQSSAELKSLQAESNGGEQ